MRRSSLFLIAAILISGLAALAVYSVLKKQQQQLASQAAGTVKIVVAARDLPVGSQLEPNEVRMAEWPRRFMPKGAFEKVTPVVGRIVKSALSADQPITAAKLAGPGESLNPIGMDIPHSMRAVSVAVNQVGDVAGFVLPHSHVDVLVTVPHGPGGQPVAKTVLENVEVLAIAQTTASKSHPQVEKVVTLLVTPEQAEQLAMANQEGALRLSLRGFGDNVMVATSGVNLSQMFGAYGAAAPRPASTHHHHHVRRVARARPVYKIQILRDGDSSETLSFDSGRLVAAKWSGKKGARHQATADPPSSPAAAPAKSEQSQADGTAQPGEAAESVTMER